MRGLGTESSKAGSRLARVRAVTGSLAQLVLDLTLEPRFGREDFLASISNEAALGAVEIWPRWPDRVQLLVGPEGAGKSHLGAIWASRAAAHTVAATALAGCDLPGIVGCGAVLVEDADRIDPAGEASLFHLVNLVRESRAFLLLTARRRPDDWALRTADLLSRLRAVPTVAIDPPDDALIRAVLVKLVADRQIAVEADVVDYVARRIDRSPAAARAVVAALDRESLVLGRRVTKVVAGELLRRLSGQSDG